MPAVHTDTQSDCRDCDQSIPTASSMVTARPADQSQALPQAESSTGPATSLQTDISRPQKVFPAITIEFCDRCRWAPRATWIQTELMLTFPTPLIRSITLIPLTSPETGGRFRVWVDLGTRVELVWDRKTEGGFPELKVLKQKLRNLISPDMGLGHSDKAGANGHGAVTIPGGKEPDAASTTGTADEG